MSFPPSCRRSTALAVTEVSVNEQIRQRGTPVSIARRATPELGKQYFSFLRCQLLGDVDKLDRYRHFQVSDVEGRSSLNFSVTSAILMSVITASNAIQSQSERTRSTRSVIYRGARAAILRMSISKSPRYSYSALDYECFLSDGSYCGR